MDGCRHEDVELIIRHFGGLSANRVIDLLHRTHYDVVETMILIQRELIQGAPIYQSWNTMQCRNYWRHYRAGLEGWVAAQRG